jgi:hypothetical protein
MSPLDGVDDFGAVSSFLSKVIGQGSHRGAFVLRVDRDIEAELDLTLTSDSTWRV